MERVRFRRPIRAGCEWIQSASGGQSLARRNDAALVLGGPQLSVDGRVALGTLLLTRLVRHPPTPHDPILLHRATQHIVRAVEARPNDVALNRALATAQLLNGDVERGIAAAQLCQVLAPHLQLELELDLLRLCLETGRQEALGARYDLLNTREPDSERFATCVAAYHRIAERHEHARTVLLGARERWPNSLWVHLEFAITLWRAGDPTSALYHFSMMRETHATVQSVQWNFVAALALTGNHAAAERELDSCTPSVASDMALRGILERTRGPAPALDLPLSGDLSAVSLADILNLLWNCRSVGTLSIDSSAGTGGLHLWKGRLVGAVSPSMQVSESSTSSMASWLSPEGFLSPVLESQRATSERRDTVYRHVRAALEEMLSWTSGRFVFQSLGEASFPDAASEVALDTPVILLEAYADLDQKRR